MTPEERVVLRRLFPIAPASYTIRPGGNVGLVIVDPVRGFTREGNLADPDHMVPMVRAIADEYRRLKAELGDRLRVLVFMDSHEADIPEPPYPPHCVVGTGEDELDPGLAFLVEEPNVSLIRKNCINGFVGAMEQSLCTDDEVWENDFVKWVAQNALQTLVFTGCCTDICVADLVLTSLSARNHGMFTFLEHRSPINQPEAAAVINPHYVAAITGMDLVVLESACETFEAPGHDRISRKSCGASINE